MPQSAYAGRFNDKGGLPVKLYHTPKAVNPERSYTFLKAKGKLDAVEIEEVSIMKLEHRTDAYKKLSPYSQVPVLVLDDGSTLTESRAICTYFEGLFPEPNLLGRDPKEKAVIEMWDRRIELGFLSNIAVWFRNTSQFMAALENPQLPEAAAKAETLVRKFVATLDEHLAANEWLAADRFTNADITMLLTCGFSSLVGWKPHKEHANIAAWYQRTKAHIDQ